MKRKIIGIFVMTLLITTLLPVSVTVFAGDEKDPEIVDVIGGLLEKLEVEQLLL